jgi:hypothetical protein
LQIDLLIGFGLLCFSLRESAKTSTLRRGELTLFQNGQKISNCASALPFVQMIRQS